MENSGHKVKKVTIGLGYNDLTGINNFKKEKTNKEVLPSNYIGYSDETDAWYIVPTTEKTQVKDEEMIK